MTWAADYTSPASSAVCLHNPLLRGLLLIYRPRKDDRLSWPCWLTHCEQFTHKVVTCPTISQAQNRESSQSKTSVLPLCYAADYSTLDYSLIQCITQTLANCRLYTLYKYPELVMVKVNVDLYSASS